MATDPIVGQHSRQDLTVAGQLDQIAFFPITGEDRTVKEVIARE